MMESMTQLRVGVLLILIVVALVSSLWSVGRTGDWEGLALNFGTEMLGAVATYVLLELFIGGRERREAKKADLIAQLGSQVPDVAIAAAEELRRHGWLTDGSLQAVHLNHADLQGAILANAELEGAQLTWANLQGATLTWANLQGAHLSMANLQGANLERANLRGVDLSCSGANLQEARLEEANLQGADLAFANLQRANLRRANLRGAHLYSANLEGAHLAEANLQGAILHKDLYKLMTLPDGTEWTSDTDMARFTDPKHPDFWEPPNPPRLI
jgi:hypothetical protein